MKISYRPSIAQVNQHRDDEYPRPQRQLEVLWKALSELKGVQFSPEVQNMMDRIAIVQAKHPYPPAGEP